MVKEVVRELRRKQTKTENILWQKVRNRKTANLKFIRQYPFTVTIAEEKRTFIVDFYCPEKRLAIEIDGSIHAQRKEYDSLRDELLKNKGINILRFSNHQVTNNLELVLKTICEFNSAPLCSPKAK